MEKCRTKAQAKAEEDDSSTSSVAWHTIKKDFLVKLAPSVAYLDSGALRHMISDQSYFSTYSTNSECKIKLADGKTTLCPGIRNAGGASKQQLPKKNV
ncbi:hypothetical protein PGT21_005688 [Puccinia graminis f. sp. tritici]|uniref:Retrovirus-related Pol polyprotein from transposon TNT 1-94-like beta-barrel domain-containing protein n=1 Tax=Puccinia graminis f. sp. tritici TaxID=56615 RepID=A0A5B0MQR5_PUCGR|nr:hypothetical protein PGT21_005688 [Puccinia graminis f. sp. tritici]KAA1082277.1 hypothetical protein PGTUg99_031099 [Puccinia graminis f. sp. tritici]